MNTPLFTVITPCYNAGDKLNMTLDSVLSQTFPDYEIIIKDARSTDGSIEGMRRDRRINLIRAKDTGIYDGMNQALATANGEYILFLNCGDVLHDEAVLESAAGEIAAAQREAAAHSFGAHAPRDHSSGPHSSGVHSSGAGAGDRSGSREGSAHRRGDTDLREPAPCIYYGDVIEQQTGQHVAANPNMTHLAMYRNLPCHQACFYSRDLFQERGFDTHYVVRADYEHFLWSVIRRGAQTRALPLIVSDYEGGGFSEREENREISEKEHEEITRMYFTSGERFRFRLYMVLTLQPLREKLAQSPKTAVMYDKVKNKLYGR